MPQSEALSESERQLIIACWTGLCWFAPLWYLGGGFWASVAAGMFASVAVALRLGSHRLAQAGVALPVLALAVAIGLPPPAQWPAALAGIPEFIAHLKIAAIG